jgi:hypothetical protein
MMRLRVVLPGRVAVSALGCILVAATPLGAEAAEEGADKLALAESVIAREETASERAFDPAFRAKAKKLLAALPLAELTSQRGEGGLGLSSLGDSQADLVYTPVTPCRIIDTRIARGTIAGGTTRSFLVTGTDYSAQGGKATGCGVPYGPTTAAVVNFVAVKPGGAGNLRVTPFGTPMPLASIINFSAGMNLANGLVVATCNPSSATCTSDITIQADASATQLVADVQGYFQRVTPPPSFLASLTTNQTVPSETKTTVIFDSVDHDTGGDYNTLNGIFTVPETGYYSLNCHLMLGDVGGADRVTLYIDKDSQNFLLTFGEVADTLYSEGYRHSGDGYASRRLSGTWHLTAGQEIVCRAWSSEPGFVWGTVVSGQGSYFSATRIR